MKKPLLIIAVCLLALYCSLPAVVALADVESDLNDSVNEGLDELDFADMDKLSQDFFGSVADKIRDIIDGKFDSAESMWQIVLSLFTDSLREIMPSLLAIFVILVTVGLIRRTSGGLISESTDSVVSFVGTAAVLASLLSITVGLFRQVYALTEKIGQLAELSAPILLTLLAAGGGNALSGVSRPAMVMFSSVIIRTVRAVILPLSVFGLIFAVVGEISSDVRVGKMSGFLNNAAGWILGVMFMLFSAFTTVQGISAAGIDGVSYRAAKFAAKNYIPLLGGYLSDGFDIVVAGATLIKNAFGVVTLLILLFSLLKPIVSVVCVNLGLQAIAAVSEPIVDGRYVKMLSGISKTLTFLAVAVIAVAFMFCIPVIIAIGSANGVA